MWCDSLGYDGRQGSFAEYAAVEQDRLYPLPEHVEPVHAAAVPHPAATAYLGLVHHLGGVHPGDVVLVGGAAGSVGSAVVSGPTPAAPCSRSWLRLIPDLGCRTPRAMVRQTVHCRYQH